MAREIRGDRQDSQSGRYTAVSHFSRGLSRTELDHQERVAQCQAALFVEHISVL